MSHFAISWSRWESVRLKTNMRTSSALRSIRLKHAEEGGVTRRIFCSVCFIGLLICGLSLYYTISRGSRAVDVTLADISRDLVHGQEPKQAEDVLEMVSPIFCALVLVCSNLLHTFILRLPDYGRLIRTAMQLLCTIVAH